MRIIIEVWKFSLAFALTPIWTKWYLPVSYYSVMYYASVERTVSVLWFIHFSIRIPFMRGVNVADAINYLPNTARPKK